MFKFDLQLFGGLFGGGEQTITTTRNIPDETPEEAALKNALLPYVQQSLSGASSTLSKGLSSLNNTYNPDWSSQISNYTSGTNSNLSNYNNSIASALANYNSGMSGVSKGYSDLASGNLPSSYATARQQALNSDLTGTVGSAISSLADRGIVDSSITNSALNNISQNASDTLAKNYSSDLSTAASLLGQQASNLGNIYSANSGTAKNLYGSTADTLNNNFTNTAKAQTASYMPTSALLSYASQLYSPASNMWSTMYSGRMNSAGTTTTQQSSGDGKDGFWGGVGALGSAAIKACFTKDTLVSTPYGKKRISDLEVGDKVLSLSADDKIKVGTVIEVRKPVKNHIVDVQFGNGSVWHTTDTQTVYTSPGMELVGDAVHPSITEDGERTPIMSVVDTGRIDNVYDVVIDGRNIFFVEGIAAEGFTEEE